MPLGCKASCLARTPASIRSLRLFRRCLSTPPLSFGGQPMPPDRPEVVGVRRANGQVVGFRRGYTGINRPPHPAQHLQRRRFRRDRRGQSGHQRAGGPGDDGKRLRPPRGGGLSRRDGAVGGLAPWGLRRGAGPRGWALGAGPWGVAAGLRSWGAGGGSACQAAWKPRLADEGDGDDGGREPDRSPRIWRAHRMRALASSG